MAIHTVVFLEDAFVSADPSPITAVDDQVLAKVGPTGLVPTEDMALVAALAAGEDTLFGARVSTPRLAGFARPWIRPVCLVAPMAGLETDTPMQSLIDAPLPVVAGEQLRIEARSATPVGLIIMLWLADRLEPIPKRPSVTVRFTGTITGEGGIWLPTAITIAEQLPQGRYAVVAAEASFADAIAARLVFPGAVFRPGFPCYPAADEMQGDLFRNRLLGVWGYFDSFAPPSIEFMAGPAVSGIPVEGFLTVIPVDAEAGRVGA